MLCSWARHLILTLLLSTQVYKLVLANLMLEVTLQLTSIQIQGGVEIQVLLVASDDSAVFNKAAYQMNLTCSAQVKDQDIFLSFSKCI